jgi:hypothetical protein
LRNLHNEELHVLSSQSNITVTRRMRRVGTYVGESNMGFGWGWEGLKEGHYLEDLVIGGRIILN